VADGPVGHGPGQESLSGVVAEFGTHDVDDTGRFGRGQHDRASAASAAKGFSHRTCFPAAMASRANWACVKGGLAMVTATASVTANASARDVQARGTSKSRARSASSPPGDRPRPPPRSRRPAERGRG